LNLHFIAIAVGEQGTDRAVRQPHRENFLRGRAGLALEKAAGKLTGGVHLFAIINRKGKEIDAFPRDRRNDRGEEDRFSIGDDHGAMGLLGHFAGFYPERSPTDFSFDYMNCHLFVTTPSNVLPTKI